MPGHCVGCDYGFEVRKLMTSDTCGLGATVEDFTQTISFPYAYGALSTIAIYVDDGTYSGWYPVHRSTCSSSGVLIRDTYEYGGYLSGVGAYYRGFYSAYTYTGDNPEATTPCP